MDGQKGLLARIGTRINSRSLLALTFVLFAAGAITLCLSFLLGIDSVRNPATGLETGFAHAPNWTSNLLLFLPLASAALAWLVHAARRLLAGLYEHRMLMDTQRNAPTKRLLQVEESWVRLLRLGVPWLIAYAVVIAGMSAYSCWTESYRPLFQLGSYEELVRFNEAHPAEAVRLNWSNAALANPPETVTPAINFVFCVLAWSAHFLTGIVFGLFLMLALTLIMWLLKHGLGFAKMRLVPDLSDPDPRCGFQRFELPAGILFAVATIFIPVFWLVIVQNLYNTGTTGATSMWELTFRYGDQPFAALFDRGGHGDMDIFWARRAGAFSILLVGVVGLGIVVPAAMRGARHYCLENLKALTPQQFEEQYGVTAEVGADRLRSMPLWPYRFVSLPELAFLAVLGILCFWWFRIAPYAVVVLAAILTMRARQLLRADATTAPDMGPGFLKYAGIAALVGAVVTAVLAWRAPDPQPEERGVGTVRVRQSDRYDPGYSKSYALLIGIGSHKFTDFAALPNAENDVATIATALRNSSSDWTISTLTGKDATRRGIMDAFGALVDGKGRNDRLLLYFAGHGTSPKEESAWIVPYDAEPLRQDRRGATWIRFEEFEKLFKDTRAKHILIALDCCYSGQLVRDADKKVPIAPDKYTTGKSWVVISAGKRDEVVADGPEGGNSPFAKAIADTLNNPPAVLTASKLHARIQTAMESYPRQTPQFDALKRDGEFLFTDYAAAKD